MAATTAAVYSGPSYKKVSWNSNNKAQLRLRCQEIGWHRRPPYAWITPPVRLCDHMISVDLSCFARDTLSNYVCISYPFFSPVSKGLLDQGSCRCSTCSFIPSPSIWSCIWGSDKKGPWYHWHRWVRVINEILYGIGSLLSITNMHSILTIYNSLIWLDGITSFSWSCPCTIMDQDQCIGYQAW